MLRKVSVILGILGLFVLVTSVSAGTSNPDADVNGCYLDSTVTSINEGDTIPVVAECSGVYTDNNVFGFQFGTSISAGDYSGSEPTSYTPGTFSSLASDGLLIGENTLALYGVSRQNADVVNVTDFTLGSYSLTADTDLTSADGSVSVTFVDDTFKLSDQYGAPLTGWLRTVNDLNVTVNDIDLAWLSGDVTVRSDSDSIGSLSTVTLDLGPKQYTDAAEGSYQTSLTMDAGYLYVENGSGVVGGSYATANDSNNTLNIDVAADMWGHLACSTSPVNLGDTGSAQNADSLIGTSGVITLLAGDANDDGVISNTDATIIGGDFGDSGVDINASYEGDMNLDTTVNIFDLVHVGRNFDATTATSACD
ncbi:MAG: hypothetical protein KME04_08955 [Pleurocapsa minor GSE-CHR-MK-17-07R]|nr:hypothetical protein [Pleurocapsa minor GSE-CHR-MK 17-07R]